MVYYSPNEQGDFCAGPKMSGQKQKGEVFMSGLLCWLGYGAELWIPLHRLCICELPAHFGARGKGGMMWLKVVSSETSKVVKLIITGCEVGLQPHLSV